MPVQVVEALAGEAINIPAGKLSVKVIPRIEPALAVLSRVMVRVLFPFKLIDAGLKLLEALGRFVATIRLAVAVPLFPALELKSPVVLV